MLTETCNLRLVTCNWVMKRRKKKEKEQEEKEEEEVR